MPSPTAGFQLSALPEPLTIPTNIGRYDVAQSQLAQANAMKNAQTASLLGPQTRALLAEAQKARLEAQNAATRAQALSSFVAPMTTAQSEADLNFERARAKGKAGVAFLDYNLGGIPLTGVAGPGGTLTPLLSGSMVSQFGQTGDIYTKPIGSRKDPSTGRTIFKYQRMRSGPFGDVPLGAPYETEVDESQNQQPRGQGTPSIVAPVSPASPAVSSAAVPVETGTGSEWFASTGSPGAIVGGKNLTIEDIPNFTISGTNNPDEAISIANKSGVPAIVPNVSKGMAPISAQANTREIQAENRKIVQSLATELQQSQNTMATIGRTMKIGDKLTTFSKVPVIGEFINQVRSLFDPEFQSVEALSKIPALTQAKNFFGSRVTNFDLESLQQAVGNVNMPADVRKEAFAAMISGIQMSTEYKDSVLEFARKYPNAPISQFDAYYSQYLQDNPIYVGNPGLDGFGMNESRITFKAYNALKNKGYENPNEFVAKNPSIVRNDGTLDESKVNPVGNPWPYSTIGPIVSVSAPVTPVSNPSRSEEKLDFGPWLNQPGNLEKYDTFEQAKKDYEIYILSK
jgi:hypothetical protein